MRSPMRSFLAIASAILAVMMCAKPTLSQDQDRPVKKPAKPSEEAADKGIVNDPEIAAINSSVADLREFTKLLSESTDKLMEDFSRALRRQFWSMTAHDLTNAIRRTKDMMAAYKASPDRRAELSGKISDEIDKMIKSANELAEIDNHSEESLRLLKTCQTLKKVATEKFK